MSLPQSHAVHNYPGQSSTSLSSQIDEVKQAFRVHRTLKASNYSSHFVVELVQSQSALNVLTHYFMAQYLYNNSETFERTRSYFKALLAYSDRQGLSSNFLKLRRVFEYQNVQKNYFEIILVYDFGQRDPGVLSKISLENFLQFLRSVSSELHHLYTNYNIAHGNISLRSIFIYNNQLRFGGFGLLHSKAQNLLWRNEYIRTYNYQRYDAFMMGCLILEYLKIDISYLWNSSISLKEIITRTVQLTRNLQNVSIRELVLYVIDVDAYKSVNYEQFSNHLMRYANTYKGVYTETKQIESSSRQYTMQTTTETSSSSYRMQGQVQAQTYKMPESSNSENKFFGQQVQQQQPLYYANGREVTPSAVHIQNAPVPRDKSSENIFRPSAQPEYIYMNSIENGSQVIRRGSIDKAPVGQNQQGQEFRKIPTTDSTNVELPLPSNIRPSNNIVYTQSPLSIGDQKTVTWASSNSFTPSRGSVVGQTPAQLSQSPYVIYKGVQFVTYGQTSNQTANSNLKSANQYYLSNAPGTNFTNFMNNPNLSDISAKGKEVEGQLSGMSSPPLQKRESPIAYYGTNPVTYTSSLTGKIETQAVLNSQIITSTATSITEKDVIFKGNTSSQQYNTPQKNELQSNANLQGSPVNVAIIRQGLSKNTTSIVKEQESILERLQQSPSPLDNQINQPTSSNNTSNQNTENMSQNWPAEIENKRFAQVDAFQGGALAMTSNNQQRINKLYQVPKSGHQTVFQNESGFAGSEPHDTRKLFKVSSRELQPGPIATTPNPLHNNPSQKANVFFQTMSSALLNNLSNGSSTQQLGPTSPTLSQNNSKANLQNPRGPRSLSPPVEPANNLSAYSSFNPKNPSPNHSVQTDQRFDHRQQATIQSTNTKHTFDITTQKVIAHEAEVHSNLSREKTPHLQAKNEKHENTRKDRNTVEHKSDSKAVSLKSSQNEEVVKVKNREASGSKQFEEDNHSTVSPKHISFADHSDTQFVTHKSSVQKAEKHGFKSKKDSDQNKPHDNHLKVNQNDDSNLFHHNSLVTKEEASSLGKHTKETTTHAEPVAFNNRSKKTNETRVKSDTHFKQEQVFPEESITVEIDMESYAKPKQIKLITIFNEEAYQNSIDLQTREGDTTSLPILIDQFSKGINPEARAKTQSSSYARRKIAHKNIQDLLFKAKSLVRRVNNLRMSIPESNQHLQAVAGASKIIRQSNEQSHVLTTNNIKELKVDGYEEPTGYNAEKKFGNAKQAQVKASTAVTDILAHNQIKNVDTIKSVNLSKAVLKKLASANCKEVVKSSRQHLKTLSFKLGSLNQSSLSERISAKFDTSALGNSIRFAEDSDHVKTNPTERNTLHFRNRDLKVAIYEFDESNVSGDIDDDANDIKPEFITKINQMKQKSVKIHYKGVVETTHTIVSATHSTTYHVSRTSQQSSHKTEVHSTLQTSHNYKGQQSSGKESPLVYESNAGKSDHHKDGEQWTQIRKNFTDIRNINFGINKMSQTGHLSDKHSRPKIKIVKEASQLSTQDVFVEHMSKLLHSTKANSLDKLKSVEMKSNDKSQTTNLQLNRNSLAPSPSNNIQISEKHVVKPINNSTNSRAGPTAKEPVHKGELKVSVNASSVKVSEKNITHSTANTLTTKAHKEATDKSSALACKTKHDKNAKVNQTSERTVIKTDAVKNKVQAKDDKQTVKLKKEKAIKTSAKVIAGDKSHVKSDNNVSSRKNETFLHAEETSRRTSILQSNMTISSQQTTKITEQKSQQSRTTKEANESHDALNKITVDKHSAKTVTKTPVQNPTTLNKTAEVHKAPAKVNIDAKETIKTDTNANVSKGTKVTSVKETSKSNLKEKTKTDKSHAKNNKPSIVIENAVNDNSKGQAQKDIKSLNGSSHTISRDTSSKYVSTRIVEERSRTNIKIATSNTKIKIDANSLALSTKNISRSPKADTSFEKNAYQMSSRQHLQQSAEHSHHNIELDTSIKSEVSHFEDISDTELAADDVDIFFGQNNFAENDMAFFEFEDEEEEEEAGDADIDYAFDDDNDDEFQLSEELEKEEPQLAAGIRRAKKIYKKYGTDSCIKYLEQLKRGLGSLGQIEISRLIGVIHYRCGKYYYARSALEWSLALYRKNYKIEYNPRLYGRLLARFALLEFKLKNPQKALGYLDESHFKIPHYRPVWYHLLCGHCYYASKSFGEARASYLEYIQYEYQLHGYYKISWRIVLFIIERSLRTLNWKLERSSLLLLYKSLLYLIKRPTTVPADFNFEHRFYYLIMTKIMLYFLRIGQRTKDFEFMSEIWELSWESEALIYIEKLNKRERARFISYLADIRKLGRHESSIVAVEKRLDVSAPEEEKENPQAIFKLIISKINGYFSNSQFDRVIALLDKLLEAIFAIDKSNNAGEYSSALSVGKRLGQAGRHAEAAAFYEKLGRLECSDATLRSRAVGKVGTALLKTPKANESLKYLKIYVHTHLFKPTGEPESKVLNMLCHYFVTSLQAKSAEWEWIDEQFGARLADDPRPHLLRYRELFRGFRTGRLPAKTAEQEDRARKDAQKTLSNLKLNRQNKLAQAVSLAASIYSITIGSKGLKSGEFFVLLIDNDLAPIENSKIIAQFVFNLLSIWTRLMPEKANGGDQTDFPAALANFVAALKQYTRSAEVIEGLIKGVKGLSKEKWSDAAEPKTTERRGSNIVKPELDKSPAPRPKGTSLLVQANPPAKEHSASFVKETQRKSKG